jgi:hypothetical protein
MACQHQYRARAAGCPHGAGRLGSGDRCLWHNPSVAKTDAYVTDLLEQADQAASGDLEEFHLAGIVWPGAGLQGRNLRGIDLRDARLAGADLTGANLSGAVLRRADLSRARLANADLSHADLCGCNLAGADLRQANLRGAIIDATVLLGADLTGADLAGARVRSFVWNRRTRLQGVAGFEPHAADSDDTQPFLAPMADQGLEGPVSRLADPDPETDRSHVYAPVDDEKPTALHVVSANGSSDHTTARTGPNGNATAATLPTGSQPPTPSSHHRWTLALGVLGLLVGLGGTVAGWAIASHRPVAPATDTALATQVQSLRQQHDADLAEVRNLGARLQQLTSDAAEARRAASMARAERDQARSASDLARGETDRLQTAADRAAIAESRAAELAAQLDAMVRANARSEQLGRILADGSARLVADRTRLEAIRDEKVVALRTNEELAEEAVRLRGELARTAAERESLARIAEQQAGELRIAQESIGRYLAKVSASGLGDQLGVGDGDGKDPLLPIIAGQPLSLGGDYLVTLRVENAMNAGRPQVRLGLTVQRPAAAANPDVTVVLYDDRQRPLRRVAFGFPHVDDGAPLVAGRTEVSCDREPHYARIVVASGGTTVGKR